MPDATSPRRFVTTVPQQALFLMNSPFVQEQARRLAAADRAGDRPDPAVASDGRDRFAGSIAESWADRPSPRELAAGRRRSSTASRPHRPTALSPWEQLAQVLMLTNEFMFVD